MSKKEAAHILRVLASVMKSEDNPLVQSWADEIYHVAEKLDDDK